MKRDIKREIKIQNPRKFSEKISKKNPPIKADEIPKFFGGFSRRLTKITVIKIKFKT